MCIRDRLCTLLFAVYSVWGFGISGFTILFEASFIGGLLLILAPVMGIVLELVLAKNMDERTQMIEMCIRDRERCAPAGEPPFPP